MGKIEKFEDLVAWQKARNLAKEIYLISDEGKFKRDFSLKDQIRRSAISVVSNIAEGFARKSNKEYIQFLYIARGSVSEVESQLYLALDIGYIDTNKFTILYTYCEEISKIIMGLIKYLSDYPQNTKLPNVNN